MSRIAIVLILSALATPALACTTDYECGYGSRCVKPSMSYTGVCAKVTDQWGTPQPWVGPRQGGGIGPGKAQCGPQAGGRMCPIGWTCNYADGLCER